MKPIDFEVKYDSDRVHLSKRSNDTKIKLVFSKLIKNDHVKISSIDPWTSANSLLIVSSWSFVSVICYSNSSEDLSDDLFYLSSRHVIWYVVLSFFMISSTYWRGSALEQFLFFFEKIDIKERRLEFSKKNIADECSNYSSLKRDFNDYVMRYWRFRSEISFVCALSSCARLKNWMNWTTSDEYDIGFGEGRMSAKGKWRSDILREETTRKERIQEDWIHDRTDWIQNQFEIQSNARNNLEGRKRIHVNRNDDSTSSSYVSLITKW